MTDKQQMWKRIHAERESLAVDLGGLVQEQWDTPSLCAGWSNQVVLGHLASGATASLKGVLPELVKNGFNLRKVIDASARENAVGTGRDTLARFTARIHNETVPFGPVEAALCEVIVHGEDIRRPLGIHRTYKEDDLMTVANRYKSSPAGIPAKKRLAGVKLVASDHPWSAGTGLDVKGPLLSLIMVLAGRADYIADLSGEGLERLRHNLDVAAA